MEIYRVEILQHIRKVELSKKQRPRYYEWNGAFIKGKKPIPKKYFKDGYYTKSPKIEDLLDSVLLCGYKNNILKIIVHSTKSIDDYKGLKFRLCTWDCKLDTYIPMLCNPRVVGTPRTLLIRGQDIYNSKVGEHTRGLIMDKIKECYKPFIINLPVINSYPVRIECEIHDTIKNFYDQSKEGLGSPFDIDNYAYPYMKAFPDLMQKLGKLRSDDRLHVTQPPSPIFCPIEDHKDRKLVFIISKDKRNIIATNEIYKNYFGNSYETEDTKLVSDEPFKDEEE